MSEYFKPAKAVDYYVFQGKCHWNHLVQPDLEFRNWNAKVYLDEPSKAQFLELRERKGSIEGILNELKKDEEGYYATFKRPMEKEYKGVKKPFTPPMIVDKDGQPWKGEYIGHGSDVTVKCECYQYKKPFNKGMGRAIRMVSVRVDNLAPYEKEQMDGEQLKQVKGLDNIPLPSMQYF